MTTFLLYLIGTTLLAVPLVLRPLLKSLAQNKARHLHCVTTFFDLAPKLAADPRLPDRQAELLHIVAQKIDKAPFVLSFIAGMIQHRKNGTRKSEGQISFNKEVDALPDDLKKSFTDAMASGILGISYSSVLFGGVLRSIWFEPVGLPQRSIDAPIFAYRGLAHC